MVRYIHEIKSHLTHRHYVYIISTSAVVCAVISIILPEYNTAGIIVSTCTNIFWVCE